MKPPEVDSELTSYGDNGSLAMRPGSSGSFCQNSESLLHRTRIGPFRNLPEKRASRWGESLTAGKKWSNVTGSNQSWFAKSRSSNGHFCDAVRRKGPTQGSRNARLWPLIADAN
jgi:hypothetical protein